MTGAEIAECLGMALSTVSAVLVRIGLGKLSRLEPPEPPNRYERSRPGRAGWEFVHVCVDDATRLAYVEVLPDERAPTAIAFLKRALGFFAAHGIHVERRS